MPTNFGLNTPAAGMAKQAAAPAVTRDSSSMQLGPQYQQMLDSNPYRGQEYYESPWQKFIGMLGFRTQADAWRENMAVQAAEYDAAIAQKAYNEQYDAAGAQETRLRAAGLNPDITGGDNVSAGSAAAMPEDPSTPMSATGEEGTLGNIVSLASSVAGACLNGFSTALGIVSSIQGIHRNRLDNTMQAIENEGAMQGLADQVLPYLIPRTPEQDEYGNTWISNAYEMAKMFTGDMPKKMQSKFQNAIMNRLNSAPTERKAWQEWSARVAARKGYFQESNTFYDESDEVLNAISSGLAKMNEEIYKATQKSELAHAEGSQAEAENQKEYFKTLSGARQAQAENEANAVSISNNQMVGIMRSNLNGIVNDLDKLSHESGIKGGLASVAMTLISMVQLWLSSQGAPSISRSSSQGMSQGPRSMSQQSSQSFSIGF